MIDGDKVRGWKKDSLTEKVIACIIKVHQKLGPGFLESIYRNAMAVELQRQGLDVSI